MDLKIKFLLLLVCVNISTHAQDVTSTANKFLSTLTTDLRSQATFEFEDEERFNINFVPMVRKGPTFHDFNDEQKNAALDLLAVSLSEVGYDKTIQTMDLEKILRLIEGDAKLSDGRLRRDPLNYHYCIFGKPDTKGVWGWRFEGHHISLNFVIREGKIVSSTPSFLGSNPAISNYADTKGKQVLKLEMDLGFKLVNSLTTEQLKLAHVSQTAPYEIVTGNAVEIDPPKIEGIPYTELNQVQKKTFLDLLKVYVENYELGFSKSLMAKIEKAGLDQLHFAWAGSLRPGAGQYYRIQGPMLIVEYDNVQNNANHVHTVVRDLTNDFAEDILREHYKKEH